MIIEFQLEPSEPESEAKSWDLEEEKVHGIASMQNQIWPHDDAFLQSRSNNTVFLPSSLICLIICLMFTLKFPKMKHCYLHLSIILLYIV